MQSRITIQDVADKAKVSKVTVSYVLNGRGTVERISESTAQRVYQAAKDLGYRPNALARMLATKQTNTLAVVFQFGEFFSTWSGFTGEVMRGVCDQAVREGFDLMLHTKSVADARSEADALADGRVDGVLVLRDQGDPMLDQLLQRGLPVVQFFTRSDDSNAVYIDSDNYSGGRIATRHLLELGHKKIAIIRGSLKSMSSNDRYNGYRDAIEQAGLKIDERYVVTIAKPNDDLSAIDRLMALPDAPTALFVWSDDVAMSCVRRLRDIGVNIPVDLSLVSFDSLEICNHTIPPLTSVKQPVFEMAQESVKMLAALIRGEELSRRQVLLPLNLEVRCSTAPHMK